MYVQVMLLEPFLQKSIARNILHLLQSVNLRKFVLNREFVVGINVRDKFPLRRLGSEGQRLVKAMLREILKLF